MDETEDGNGMGEEEKVDEDEDIDADIDAEVKEPDVGTADQDPLKEYYMVSLRIKGAGISASSEEGRLLERYFLLHKDQRVALDEMRVDFYRTLRRVSSFKIDGKHYVVHESDLKAVQDKFIEVSKRFGEFRKNTFEDLMKNWEAYVERDYRRNKIMIPKDQVLKLLPSDSEFMDLEMRTVPVLSWLMGGDMGELIAKIGANSPEARSIMEMQKKKMMANLKMQYEKLITDLQGKIEKLKDLAVKKGKRYYKTKESVERDKKTVEDLSTVLGEKEATEIKLRSMFAALGEDLSEDDGDENDGT
ncbi:hypothetical protein DMB44_04140 [Thermoplasma sp. Kam2015]|nr:hypothetical protein DMB44_04140 [Thermoplasma sp. Kam2015]